MPRAYWLAGFVRSFDLRPRSRQAKRRWSVLPAIAEILEDRTLLAAAFDEFVDPNPVDGNRFGEIVFPLSTGNVVVTAPDDAGGKDAGAVYLFNGDTCELISTVIGSSDGDQIGNGGVSAIANGNFLIVLAMGLKPSPSGETFRFFHCSV